MTLSPEARVVVRKYFDIRGWLLGMYANAMKSATGVFLIAASTNVAEGMAPASVGAGVGLGWKQAVVAFMSVLFLECVRYINNKPLPDEVDRPITPPPFPPKL
jgi:hypothetical protein